MPELAGRSALFRPQPMFEILSAAQQVESKGREVIHLEIGDTQGFANPIVVEHLRAATDDPNLGYVASGGTPALREAFASIYATEKKVAFDWRNVAVAPANALISQYLGVVCDPGDGVLIPDPGFPTYYLAAEFNGLDAVAYPLDPAQGWSVELSNLDLLLAQNPHVRCVLINTPSNPLGTVMSPEALEATLAWAENRGLHCLLDETYKNLVFEGEMPRARHRPNITYLYSLSKDAAAPGLRVGCAVSEDRLLVQKLVDYSSLFFSCGPGLMQEVALAYVSSGTAVAFATQMRHEIAARLLRVEEILAQVPEATYVRPSAAFYLFLDISATGLQAREFAYALLDSEGVCVCPGESFGERGRQYVRLTLSGDPVELELGIQRVATFINERMTPGHPSARVMPSVLPTEG